MSRPTFQSIYMQLALLMAERSTCSRLSVGAVLTSSDYRRVLAVGYNGGASGMKNGCDNPKKKGNCGCIHAEDNLAANCIEPRETKKIAFITHAPCLVCAKRLVNLGGIEKVYYRYKYRCDEGIELLEKAGLNPIQTYRAIIY